MNSDYPAGHFFKHKMVPLAVERVNKKATKEDALQAAYDLVDKRDGGKCWVTGVATAKGAPDQALRREHHHLRGRRVMPEWREDADRIVTVSRLAHQLITQ